MALIAAKDRSTAPNTVGTKSRQPLAASMRPFQGSIVGLKPDGYARPLASGDTLLGVSEKTADLEDVSATDGVLQANIDRGIQTCELPVTGVARKDVASRRLVFASDDGTFGFIPGGTLIGPVVGVAGTNLAIVQMIPHHFVTPGIGSLGSRDLADADALLTTADLDKILRQTNTAARTLTLPPAADCAGRFLTVVKNGVAAFAITLDANAAETIDGAATLALAATAVRDRVTIWSDGTAWTRVA